MRIKRLALSLFSLAITFALFPPFPHAGVATSAWRRVSAAPTSYAADNRWPIQGGPAELPANNLELVGRISGPGYAVTVTVEGCYAYVAATDKGLRVIDVSNPAGPGEVGYYITPTWAEGVAVAGGYAYVTDREKGLRVIDVSNPADPREVGSYITPGNAEGVAVAGSYAYVAASDKGLRVIDVSSPAAPREVGYYITPAWAKGVAVAGTYAYLAATDKGLRVIDVSNPASPREVGYYIPPTWPTWAEGVAVAGSYAYVTDWEKGLRIIDVSNPANPRGVGYYATPGWSIRFPETGGVTVAGRYAYLAASSKGLRVIDVSSPTAPKEVGYYDTRASGVAVAGSYAYVAAGNEGVLILRFEGLDATPPGAVIGTVKEAWVARYDGPAKTTDHPNALAVDGRGNVYVTGSSKGVGTDWDYATVKYDANGNQLWVARYNGPGDGGDKPSSMVLDGQGNVYVTGVSQGNSTSSEYATIKYDTSGNQLWVARYKGLGSGESGATALALDGQGNVFVTGWSSGIGTDSDFATVKYDTNGNQLWVARHNGTGNGRDDPSVLMVDGKGNVHVAGYSEGVGAKPDYATVEYDTNGNERSIAHFGGPMEFVGTKTTMVLDNQGNLYVVGESRGASGVFGDYATIKYDKSGNQLWVARYKGPGKYTDGSGTLALALDQGGNAYIAVTSLGTDDKLHYATIKYHTNGNQLWAARYRGPQNWDGPRALTLDGQGNVYVTGWSFGGVTDNYATVKYDTDGNQLWVSRYTGPGECYSYPSAVTVDGSGNVYVTGSSDCISVGPDSDYATVKYVQAAIDAVSPSPVNSLRISKVTTDSATLTWTAPGDDGNTGTAATYDVRYSTSVITTDNWASATQASGEPRPQPAGSPESFVVTGLLAGTTYYFALKTADEVPNWSGLSNVVSGTTTSTALQAKITSATDKALQRLDDIRAEGARTASDADYFADKLKRDAWNAVIDAIFVTFTAGADYLASGGKAALQLKLPGVDPPGWMKLLRHREDYASFKFLFNAALKEDVTRVGPSAFNKAIFTDGMRYYAAAMAGKALEWVDKELAKTNLKNLISSQKVSGGFAPLLDRGIADLKKNIADQRDLAVRSAGGISPGRESEYLDDLAHRDEANLLLASMYASKVAPLHEARGYAQNPQWSDQALKLFMWAGISLAVGMLDGPAIVAFAVSGLIGAAKLVLDNSRELSEDARWMELGVMTMGNAVDTAIRINRNISSGFSLIERQDSPKIARGSAKVVAHKSVGERKWWKGWTWAESSSYTDIEIDNTGEAEVTYEVYAQYRSEGFLGTSVQSLVGEASAIHVQPVQKGKVRIYYKRLDNSGKSPAKDSNITFDILGTSGTGTYLVATLPGQWTPERVTTTMSTSGSSLQGMSASEDPVIDNPISAYLVKAPDSLVYRQHILVANPFTDVITASVSQSLPADAKMIDTEGGALTGQQVNWTKTVNPAGALDLVVSFTYAGSGAATVSLPAPTLKLVDPATGNTTTFDALAGELSKRSPLRAEAAAPKTLAPGTSAALAFSVKNLKTDVPASGTITVRLVDLSNKEIARAETPVTVDAAGTLSIPLTLSLPPSTVGGLGVMSASLSSEGVADEIFAEVVAIQTVNQIQLADGWNFISVPSALRDPSVGAVFDQTPAVTKVYTSQNDTWSYGFRSDAGWTGPLTRIADGKGYWAYATAAATLTISSDAYAPKPSYSLSPGWNMIGYTSSVAKTPVGAYLASISGKWAKVYRHDASKGWELAMPGGAGFADMELGRGYWIQATEATTLVP